MVCLELRRDSRVTTGGEALQIALKRREAKSKGEKERYKHLNAEFQRIARIDNKAFLSDQCKEIDVFLEFSCFFDDPADVGNLISMTTLPRLEAAYLFLENPERWWQ